MSGSHLLSMSKVSLAHRCAYSFRPDVVQSPRPTGRAAKLGSLVHRLAEAHVKRAELDVSQEDPELLAEAQGIFGGPLRGFLDSREWTSCEAGLRLDAGRDVCEDGPRRGEPGYEDVGPMVLPGTLDLVAVDGDFAVSFDLKSGKPPSDNEQLLAQAAAVSRRYGVSTVEVAYVRALKTKLELLNREVLDADRLDYEAGRIARVLRRLPTARPSMGEHCWKCDAFAACPAQQDAKQDELEAAGYFG